MARVAAFTEMETGALTQLLDDVLYTPRNGLVLAVAFPLVIGGEGARRRQKRSQGSQPPAEPIAAAG